METHNGTVLNEFILMGITDHPELQAPLFGLFLIIYVISVVGNLGMIILTQMDSKLQTPMYFFLKHLAFTDLGYSTTVGSKMLINFVENQNIISYYSCAMQLAFFLVFIVSEIFILSAMSHDHYVAICNPLLYPVIMSQRVCWAGYIYFSAPQISFSGSDAVVYNPAVLRRSRYHRTYPVFREVSDP